MPWAVPWPLTGTSYTESGDRGPPCPGLNEDKLNSGTAVPGHIQTELGSTKKKSSNTGAACYCPAGLLWSQFVMRSTRLCALV